MGNTENIIDKLRQPFMKERRVCAIGVLFRLRLQAGTDRTMLGRPRMNVCGAASSAS